MILHHFIIFLIKLQTKFNHVNDFNIVSNLGTLTTHNRTSLLISITLNNNLIFSLSNKGSKFDEIDATV